MRWAVTITACVAVHAADVMTANVNAEANPIARWLLSQSLVAALIYKALILSFILWTSTLVGPRLRAFILVMTFVAGVVGTASNLLV